LYYTTQLHFLLFISLFFIFNISMSLSNHEIFEISKAFIYLFFYISKSILFCFTRRDKNLNERL